MNSNNKNANVDRHSINIDKEKCHPFTDFISKSISCNQLALPPAAPDCRVLLAEPLLPVEGSVSFEPQRILFIACSDCYTAPQRSA